MNTQDVRTIQRMKQFGGSFVAALANAAQYADEENLKRIKSSWPEYWRQYEDLDKQLNRPTKT